MQMREAKKKIHLPMSELSSFDQVDERSRQHGCVPTPEWAKSSAGSSLRLLLHMLSAFSLSCYYPMPNLA